MAESLLNVLDLNPSVAIFPLQLAQGSTPTSVVDYLHARIETLVGIEPKTGDPRKHVFDVQSLSRETVGGWVYTGALYRVEVAPSWLKRKPPTAALGDDDIDGDDGNYALGSDEDEDDPKNFFRQQIWHVALIGVAADQGRGWAGWSSTRPRTRSPLAYASSLPRGGSAR